MTFLYAKALHIIFVVTWFSGLFYIVRLFIYHSETKNMPLPARKVLQKQYQLMSKRLWYIIACPSAVLASAFGIYMLSENINYYLSQNWMLLKIFFVLFLYGYHLACHLIFIQLQKNDIRYNSFQLRLWNEVATIILFSVVFLVVLKNAFSWIWGVTGLISLSILLMILARWYKRIREKK